MNKRTKEINKPSSKALGTNTSKAAPNLVSIDIRNVSVVSPQGALTIISFRQPLTYPSPSNPIWPPSSNVKHLETSLLGICYRLKNVNYRIGN